MFFCFDIENSITKRIIEDDTKLDLSPYNANNHLLSIGWATGNYIKEDKCFLWQATQYIDIRDEPERIIEFQTAYKNAKLVIGQNLKHDYEWLLETGILEEYHPKIWDTLLAEYVLSRGNKRALDLNSISNRYGFKTGKIDINYDKIHELDHKELKEYTVRDIELTEDIFEAQYHEYMKPSNNNLLAQFQMNCQFMPVITDMKRDGIAIDLIELDRLEKEYKLEQTEHEIIMQDIIQEYMGDTPVNLNSRDDMSALIYGFKVKDKNKWKEIFNIGTEQRGAGRKPKPLTHYTSKQLEKILNDHTTRIERTKATLCVTCDGKGYIRKFRLSGEPFKKETRCTECDARRYIYEYTGFPGGFAYSPRSYRHVSESGFSTDKETLHELFSTQKLGKPNEFLERYIRYNAISTYLDTFIAGIKNNVGPDGIIHPDLLQHVTATGRLAGRNPNFQNQPRGNTFPIRRCVISRFQNGKIVSADYAQLEFRVAGELSNDTRILEDVLNKIDIHAYTASIIECSRQDAKPHTFKPVYGGRSGTDKERAYYDAFRAKYKELDQWHERLKREAISIGKVRVQPTGMEFAFPNAKRLASGYVVSETNIVNYPVQYFATGVITPLACIDIKEKLKEQKLKSVLFVTVHDSIDVDAYPGEEFVVAKIMKESMINVPRRLKQHFNYDFTFPLDVEVKIGDNWLDLKVVNEI